MAGGRMPRWRARRRDVPRPDVHTLAQRGSATARFRALAAIARVSWSPGSEPLLPALAASAREALDAASVSLSAWEPELGQIRCLVNEGLLGPGELADPTDEVYAVDDFLALGLLLESQLGWVCDAELGPPDDPSVRLLRELGKRSGISVPVPGPGRVWGELYATRTSTQTPFTDDDLELAVAVAAQVGAALVTAEHLRRAEHQLHLDPVTGLASRGEVDDRLDAAVASWTAEQVPVALLMVDVVGLRDLVATDGRQAADQVVRRCAALVSATAGHVPGAFAGRYDWDRFCVVVPGRPADESVALADALVRQARRTLPLPVSCGVVATDDIPGPVPTRDRLVRLVEAAQSRARQAGGLVPVVAGRHLPEQALPAGAPGTPLPGPEGGEPGRSASLGVLVRLGVDAVDHAGPRVVDRLVAVASLLCHHVDGLGWWVSTVVDGRRVVTVEFARLRLTPTMTTGPGEPEWTDDGYLLADYPATQSAVAGGWFVVEASDPGADPAELALLDGMGAASLLAAGGADDDGRRWLVEVVGDSLSRPLEDAATALRALLPSALRPLGSRQGDALPAPDPAVVTTR